MRKIREAGKMSSITPEGHVDLKPGDIIEFDVRVHRIWWQLWKPRYSWERREFVVVE